eukprot:2193200-Prymnesium_polylepis.1
MAATRPSYPRVVRFIGGVGVLACATIGALDGLLATLLFTHTYRPYNSDKLRQVVAWSIDGLLLA